MKMVYEHYTGRDYNEPISEEGNAHVKAIHYIQSFAPDDNVTPELAHRIAKAFVKRAFGTNVQAVIATHTDKTHLHSHIIINAVDIEGNHLYANKSNLRRLRYFSDGVAKVFGVYPHKNITGTGKAVKYNEWQHQKQGTSWKEQIRNEINRLIPFSRDLDELLKMLEYRGYTIKRGKYISIKAPGQQRAVRLKNLGAEYTEESLKIRIQYRGVANDFSAERYTVSELYRSYTEVLNDTRILADKRQKVERRYDLDKEYSANNDLDVYYLSAQLSVINQHKITSIGELQGQIQRLESAVKSAETEVNNLLKEIEKTDTFIKQATEYFELLDKHDLSETEELKLNLLSKAMQETHIDTPDDVENLKKMQAENDRQLAKLGESLEKNCTLLNVYRDISETYERVSKGDYISRLVEEKRQADEQIKKKSPKRKPRR